MITPIPRRSLVFLVAGLLGNAAALHAQNVIVNGDFEAAPGADDSTTTFPGWGEFQSATAAFDQTANAAKVHAGLGGNTAAWIPGESLAGALRQDVPGPEGFWKLELDFAMVDPGDPTDNPIKRGLNINLFHNLSTGANINLSVFDNDGNGLGEVRVVSGSAGVFTFHTVLTDVVPFSIDGGLKNGRLSDPEDTLNIVHLTITGNYDATPSYTITVNGTTSLELAHFQNGGPGATTNNIDRIVFSGNNGGTQSYIVDNVSLVPEPGSAALLGLGAGLLGIVRRRG